MKTTRFFIYSIIALAFVLSNCKDKDISKPKTIHCLLSGFLSANSKINYFYDNQDRIIKQNYTTLTDSIISSEAYNFSNSNTIIIDKNSDLYTGEITLNQNGDAIVKKETYYESRSPDIISSISETEYTYNAAGNLILENLSFKLGGNTYTYFYEYTWMDGNLTFQKNINSKGLTETTFSYTYTDLTNSLAKTEQLVARTGIKSKNLAKSREEIKPGTASILTTYSFGFNSLGNLEKMSFSIDGAPEETNLVNWICN